MKRVAILQPNFLPWRGYFDIINQVDEFVIYDDVKYTKQDWRNRNRVKTPGGPTWITVPVESGATSKLICDVAISDRYEPENIKKTIQMAYSKAPFFSHYFDSLCSILDRETSSLIDLDVALIRYVNQAMKIDTQLSFSTEIEAAGHKTERLINLLKKCGATHYLSGPAARDYIDSVLFEQNEIVLEYMSYNYPPYPQLWGAFEPYVSVIDLLFNVGPDSIRYFSQIV